MGRGLTNVICRDQVEDRSNETNKYSGTFPVCPPEPAFVPVLSRDKVGGVMLIYYSGPQATERLVLECVGLLLQVP